MTEPLRSGAPPSGVPSVVVVGAASRDLAPDDLRGWRLGGGVTYAALTTARLGLQTAALIGVDRDAAEAAELSLLRDAGVNVRLVPLAHGPVFDNVETTDGRRQFAFDRSDPVSVDALPAAWRRASAWILAPVAGELSEEWADALPSEAIIALGWQGLLRDLAAGAPVRQMRPGPSRLLARADIVGLSRDDVDPSIGLDELSRLLRPGATLVLTQGDRGGIVLEAGDRARNLRRYRAVPSVQPVDPTGAGDAFLAGLLAARTQPKLVGGRIGQGFDLLLAAAVASLVAEGPGLGGVPDRSAIRRRMSEGLAAGR